MTLLDQILANHSLYNLPHPYARYGLAVALMGAKRDWEFENATEKDLPEILAREIEAGLNRFRLETQDDPTTADTLRFGWITLEALRKNKSLVQGELSKLGKYLAPTVLTTDGDAGGTYDNAEKLIKALRERIELDNDGFKLTRSFAPTTSKINNGNKSQSEPKTTLFEAACSVIATTTGIKPAAYARKQTDLQKFFNTMIIPDLPLSELIDFAELFHAMLTADLGDRGNLFHVKITRSEKESRTARNKAATPKVEYKRPPIFNGNYPFAPRNAAFGGVGLLAAIGRWAVRANEEEWARKVLNSLSGTPLYIISYDGISQVQFSHHVVELAKKDKLSDVINKLAFETQIYSALDSTQPRWKIPAYQLFDLLANRFLQLFNQPAFGDFLAIRAEYAPEINTLFEEYFMRENKIPKEIVESAREYGQWLNRTAYFVAKNEVSEKTENREARIRKEKAKILIEFESAARSAETPQDMFDRVSTRAGRLLQSDAPAEATHFMDAAMSGDEVTAKDALQMLVAYMRLRSGKTPEGDGTASASQTDNPNHNG
ncbi:MAG: hypothetical protein ACJ74J_18265 [Blastocatellia bacterium]